MSEVKSHRKEKSTILIPTKKIVIKIMAVNFIFFFISFSSTDACFLSIYDSSGGQMLMWQGLLDSLDSLGSWKTQTSSTNESGLQ